MNATASVDHEQSQDLLTEEQFEALESPTTVAGWRKLLAQYPKNGLKIINRRGGGGRKWTPAALSDVYGEWAIIIPANHHRTEKVPLRDIKVWKKGTVEQIRRQRHAPVPRVSGLNPAAFDDPDRIVVYCNGTRMFLGGGRGKRSLYFPLAHATPYANRMAAQTAIAKFFVDYPRGKAELRSTLELMTKAQALARFRDLHEVEAKPSGSDAEPAGNSAVAGAVEATGAASGPVEPQKAETQPIEAPKVPAPTVPNQAACAECFAVWQRLMTEEADAEALLLEIRGKRIQAAARRAIDEERRRLGIA